MQLRSILPHNVSLGELEDIQTQLHQLLVEKYGAAAAAEVLGRALAGTASAQTSDSTAAAAAAAAAAKAAPAAPGLTAQASAGPAAKQQEQSLAGGGAAKATAAVQKAVAWADATGQAEPPPSAATAAAASAAAAADAGLPPKGSLHHSVSEASNLSDVSDSSEGSAHMRWQRAVGLALHNADPWAGRRIHKLQMELVTRYRYTASTRAWVKDEVLVKMERRPFAAGAMRECYALKKLSTFSSSVYRDWRKAPNFVAKRYKKPVDRQVYFADVVLQMDAKFLGDEYNKTAPPKKVDVMQAAVLEFRDRPDKPLFCVEHMIEGDYVKYNSNSGFVATQPLLSQPSNNISKQLDSSILSSVTTNSDAVDGSSGSSPTGSPKRQQQQQQQPLVRQLSRQLSRQSSGQLSEQAIRHTPQAFSHFTYSFTQGTALCVDIQGVADLYTDPQIHTLDGQGYGDGNLGLRGMALFFRTHECNLLCSRLKLEPFERCATDVAAQGYMSSSSTRSGTICRSAIRCSSVLGRLELQRQMEQQPGPSKSLQDLLAQLEDVPMQPSPDALIHWEVARIYAETVTLPELRPEEDPDAARLGGMFHLHAAAAKGLALAQLQLACGHLGLEPSSTQLAHLLKEAKAAGEFVPHPQLALRYTQLAAERGVKGAASALSYAYATGAGVGEGCLPGPLFTAAVTWLRKILQANSDCPGELFSAVPDGLNPRTASTPGAVSSSAAAAAAGTPVTPGSSSTPGGNKSTVTPRNSIARLISGRGGRGGMSPAMALSSPGLLGPDGVPVGSLFAIADKLTQAAEAALTTARTAFNEAAEEESKLLPGGSRALYELWADLGELLLKGGGESAPCSDAAAASDLAVCQDEEETALLGNSATVLLPDPAAAAEAFNAAAEEASAAFKGKLAQRYFERAAEAEAAAEGDAE